jgi:hypothetical protein
VDTCRKPNHLQLINSGVPKFICLSFPYYRTTDSALTGKLVNILEQCQFGKVSGRKWKPGEVNFLDDRIPRYRTIVILSSITVILRIYYRLFLASMLYFAQDLARYAGGCAPMVYLIWRWVYSTGGRVD